MKDEIKEILDLLKYCVEKNEYLEEANMEKWKHLLDYITNLQEEVKFTEDYKDAYETTMIANKMLEEKYIDYKSRIDKAIESLTKNKYVINLKEVLNILNGDDSDE